MGKLLFVSFPYSAAFFHAQIEERRTSRMSYWFNPGDLQVLVAISCVGVYLIEPREGVRIYSSIGLQSSSQQSLSLSLRRRSCWASSTENSFGISLSHTGWRIRTVTLASSFSSHRLRRAPGMATTPALFKSFPNR